jgi:hypothetical protein
MHTRTRMVAPVEALPGRQIPMELEPLHYVKKVWRSLISRWAVSGAWSDYSGNNRASM